MDSRIFQKECRSLANAGFDTTLLVMNGTSEIVDGVKIVSIDHNVKGRVKRILTAGNRIFDKAVELNADLYHLHDPELLRIAVKLQKKTGAKVVYDSHEDLPKQVLDKHWIPSLIRPTVSKFVSKYEMRKASKISGIISVTEKICNRFKKANPNVCLVANYPILSDMNASSTLGIEKEDRAICYIGGLFPTRGIKELILALEECNATLHLAGNFSSEAFESEVKALPGWSKVKFYGYVSKKEIAEILLKSHAGIVTLHPTQSYKESLPIKMFEYMSASLPVISSNFEMWKPLVLDNKCGVMIDPMNVSELAIQIDYLLNNREIAEKMGAEGYKAAHNKYSWVTQEAVLIEFYERLLKEEV